MEISIVEGIGVEKALQDIERVLNNITNAYSASPGATLYARYINWTNESIRILNGVIDIKSVSKLITTTRYWSLITAANHEIPEVLSIINTELAERTKQITFEVELIKKEFEKWKYFSGVLVIADTSVYLHSNNYFDKVDWHEIARIPPEREIRIIIPIQVIDELDDAKTSNRTILVSETNKEMIRDRARQTLKKINQLFMSVHEFQTLTVGIDNYKKTSIGLDIDSIYHVPVANADGEILDLALSLRTRTNKNVKIVTRDTGMHLRARNIGLESELTD